MKIGPNPPRRISSKLLVSKRGLRWVLLAFTLLYGLLDSHPEFLPGFETLLNSGNCKHVGMPVTVRDSAYVRLLLPLTQGQPFSARLHPQRLICLAATKSAPPISPGVLESEQGLLLAPQTLDTITCWEAHND
jgi:hypothetical protein